MTDHVARTEAHSILGSALRVGGWVAWFGVLLIVSFFALGLFSEYGFDWGRDSAAFVLLVALLFCPLAATIGAGITVALRRARFCPRAPGWLALLVVTGVLLISFCLVRGVRLADAGTEINAIATIAAASTVVAGVAILGGLLLAGARGEGNGRERRHGA